RRLHGPDPRVIERDLFGSIMFQRIIQLDDVGAIRGELVGRAIAADHNVPGHSSPPSGVLFYIMQCMDGEQLIPADRRDRYWLGGPIPIPSPVPGDDEFEPQEPARSEDLGTAGEPVEQPIPDDDEFVRQETDPI